MPHDMQIAFLLGIVVSAITGCLTIAFFLNFLRTPLAGRLRRVPHCFWHNSYCSGLLPLTRRMKYLGPTRHARLNEAVAVVFLFAGLFVFFSLASYHPFDPSLNTASARAKPVNLTGRSARIFADFFCRPSAWPPTRFRC